MIMSDLEKITITDSALKRLNQLKDSSDIVELSVVGGGCAGMSYNFKFVDRESNERDHIVEKDGVKILVPFSSYVYLVGTEIDFSNDLLNGGFRFNNPKANRDCGCGISFSV